MNSLVQDSLTPYSSSDQIWKQFYNRYLYLTKVTRETNSLSTKKILQVSMGSSKTPSGNVVVTNNSLLISNDKMLWNYHIKWPHNKKECVLANIKLKYINLKIKRIIHNNYHWFKIVTQVFKQPHEISTYAWFLSKKTC